VGALDSLLEKYRDDLNGLVDRFRSSGLGETVESWIGTDQEITRDEIEQGPRPAGARPCCHGSPRWRLAIAPRV